MRSTPFDPAGLIPKCNLRLELVAQNTGLVRFVAIAAVLFPSEFQFGQSRSDNFSLEVPQNTAFMAYLIRSFWDVDHPWCWGRQVSRPHVRMRSRRGSGFWSHKHRSHHCVPIAMPEEVAEAITRSANPKHEQ